MRLRSWRPTLPVTLGGAIRVHLRLAVEGVDALEVVPQGVVATVHGVRWLLTQPGSGEIDDPAPPPAPANSSREKRR